MPRIVPVAGMAVEVRSLGETREARVDEVADGGRALRVGEEWFDLHRRTAKFVRRGEPYYGTRLAFPAAEDDG
ncbi:MAG: hypothetical protein U0T02_06420 [Solirubrobacteraceae bacterium]